MIRLVAFLLLCALPLKAEEVVAGLSHNRVSITANFDGSEILIFGAVKRDAPAPDTGRLGIIITVAGPATKATVRKKSKHFGIWLNSEAVTIDVAPSLYAVATSAPLYDILTATEDLRYKISTPRAIRSVGAPADVKDPESFTEALIRIRTKNRLYQLSPESVIVTEQTLFRTSVALPANLTEGTYTARIFLTRNGNVVDKLETSIDVRKVGLERWLYRLAHEQPLLYGLLSLFIAVTAGWGASTIFRLLRG
ncbi:MAG: TIGR02186 family protein [Marinosulfonomonas sp.]